MESLSTAVPSPWTITRVIFGLLSAIGVLIGIEYTSIRAQASATAADLASLRHSVAQMETRQQVAEERSKHADDGFIEIQHRLETIDARLADIREEVAVLADRASRSSVNSPQPLSSRTARKAETLP
jgi:chromosome segregation ATPase